MTFIALVLYRFDISRADHAALPNSSTFPRLEEKKPCLGIMGPAKGHDVYLKVKPAKP